MQRRVLRFRDMRSCFAVEIDNYLLLWIQTSARLKGERRCARETDAKSRVLQVMYDKVRRRFSMVGRPRRAFSTVQREKTNFPQRNRANRNKSAEDILRKRKKKTYRFHKRAECFGRSRVFFASRSVFLLRTRARGWMRVRVFMSVKQ